VRAEVEHHAFLPATEDHRIGQGSETGANLNGPATGVIHNTVLVRPAVDVPGPAGQRAVDDRGPYESKDHSWEKATALSDSSHDDSCSNAAELHLKHESDGKFNHCFIQS